jgi:D-glycerate 3-kinase
VSADALERLLAEERLPASYRETVERVARPLAGRVTRLREELARPAVVGLCGSQGSGKSTLAGVLAAFLQAEGLAVAVLSIDDLYLPRRTRQALAARVHPLFATRGPPGSHDVRLGLELLDRLTVGTGEAALPRFDKARDAPAPRETWPRVAAPVDVVVLEGWMVGARPQAAEALTPPVNALEREEDADGRWRAHVNAALAGDYQALFARLDLLVLLQAPGFEEVYAWRALQEARLAERLEAQGRGERVMDEAALRRFIAHYERLTRWILQEMPGRADIVVRLGPDHEIEEVSGLPAHDRASHGGAGGRWISERSCRT